MRILLQLLALMRALASDRARLATENLLLRQQIAVLKRSARRVRLDDGDRAFWVAAWRWVAGWKAHLVIVKPETVVRWHREAFRRFWGERSRRRRGRPPIGADVVALIRRMSSENPLWGAPQIASELALLGHVVADSTVAKYMVPRSRRPPSQGWRTFLRNHLGASAACDLFTVPKLTFKLLYAFVVLRPHNYGARQRSCPLASNIWIRQAPALSLVIDTRPSSRPSAIEAARSAPATTSTSVRSPAKSDKNISPSRSTLTQTVGALGSSNDCACGFLILREECES